MKFVPNHRRLNPFKTNLGGKHPFNRFCRSFWVRQFSGTFSGLNRLSQIIDDDIFNPLELSCFGQIKFLIKKFQFFFFYWWFFTTPDTMPNVGFSIRKMPTTRLPRIATIIYGSPLRKTLFVNLSRIIKISGVANRWRNTIPTSNHILTSSFHCYILFMITYNNKCSTILQCVRF